MSDLIYRTVRFIGRPVFWISSRPVAIGEDRVPLKGRCIIASTHQSPYDVPLLIRHSRRLLDFLSIREMFNMPVVGQLYASMNALPLDRSRVDDATVRMILRRLERERVIVMFPEGGLKKEEDSVVRTRRIRPGIGRIANLSGAPVVPCVVIGSSEYSRAKSWLPVQRTRYGVIYGEALAPTLEPQELEQKLVDAFVSLHGRLKGEMGRGEG